MKRIPRGLPSFRDKPKEAVTEVKGESGEYVTYDFPSDLGDQEIRKKIGYAQVEGVTGFNCGNCKFFSLGFCRKFHIAVKKSACCSSWEK